MKGSFGKKDVLWGYAGYIADIAVYALLTPVLAIFLAPYELGLWYTFMSIYSFLISLDGAFSPIITRNASYCMSGARELVADGLPALGASKEPNYGLLASLYKANRKLMLLISGIAIGVLVAIGTPYIGFITRDAFEIRYIVSWLIFSVGVSLNVYVLSVPSFLKGIGAIAVAQKCIVWGRTIQLAICLGSVLLGYGIAGLSVGIFAGAAVIGLLGQFYIKTQVMPQLPPKSAAPTKSIIHTIWYNSKKLLITAVGSYGISQVNTLLCSTFIALEVTASYGLTNQAFQAVGILAFVWMQISTPAISAAKAKNDLPKQRSLFSVSCIIYYTLFILGAAVVIVFANPVLRILGAKTLLLGIPYILIAAFNAFVEKHISLYSNFIMCGNHVPYVKAALLSGAAVCLLSSLTLYFTNWGILGLLLSQTVVQLSYNAWKWCYIVCKELQVSWPGLLLMGFRNAKVEIAGIFSKKRDGV